MLELKKVCEEKVTSRSVEPNSPLWEPVTFILNQWERLTLFCEAPGVPLDTNLVEQALIVPVRYLAGSFNYHTENGAVVGDHAMSLIATARAPRCRTRRVLDRVPTLSRGPRQEARALPAVGLPRSRQRCGRPSASRGPHRRAGAEQRAATRPCARDRGRRPERGRRPRAGPAARERGGQSSGGYRRRWATPEKQPFDNRFVHSQNPEPS
jgi:hypothetical protein